MNEPTEEELRQAFGACGIQAPPDYLWLVERHTMGFNAFTQMEPWHFCGIEEIKPLSKRWPASKLKRDLVPFARRQGHDDLACFEFDSGKLIKLCVVHYDLGPPVYFELGNEFETIWEWLKYVVDDMKFWRGLTIKHRRQ